MTEQTDKTVLLDVVQALGRIEGQNQLILQEQGSAAASRKEQYRALEAIRADVQDVKSDLSTASKRVDMIEPDVEKMKAFRTQLGLAVVIVTSVVTGALNLVWLGLTNLQHIRSALREFLR